VAAKRALEPLFYPYGSHLLEDMLKPICSEHCGISQSLLVSPMRYSDALHITSVMSQMPAYHKVILNPHWDMQYHLSGYGTFYEEAMVRLVGEAIERYALLTAPCTLGDKIEYASYNDIAKRGRVMPFEYLRPFSNSDYAKLNRGQFRGYRALEGDDVIGWMRCPSLFDPGTDIWTPAQMLFTGHKVSRDRGEVAFCPGFSTGTAAHTSLEKALQNALLEFVEIDALMLCWYTDCKAAAITVDDLTMTALLPKLLAPDSQYEVLALDMRMLKDVDAHAIGSVVINKRNERPFIMMGAQGHLHAGRAFYRSLMEAVAISFLGIYGPVYVPKEYLTSTAGNSFTDLDTNVSLFASPENAAEKRAMLNTLFDGRRALSTMKNYDTGNIAADNARLIRQLSRVSEYGVFLDVTPPETRDLGWKVMRVFFPELVTMCVPGVPYSEHPRVKAYGGIRNEYPHPLP